ncbi:MAG: KH domain-containing protein [Candidatus Diapherotrites archaeon]|nr:KH domain-containing protein [Candidatus Diapherotrites archaeon]
MLEETIKIPIERIPILIGKEGSTRKEIEQTAKVKLDIDSKTGTVNIEVTQGDAVQLEQALSIVHAIARGFNPGKAMLLASDEYYFETMNLKDIVGKSEKAREAIKSRVIGKNGKMREQIEHNTHCFVSVYGHTISIIGKLTEIDLAREAIERIMNGANLVTVQKFLNKRSKQTQEIDF